jgi:hypothetical protein
MTEDIVIVKCYRFWSDCTSIESVEINLKEYAFFELDYRLDSWHIIAHKKVNEEWVSNSISVHGVCGNQTLVDFIIKCNSFNEHQKCKVSRFNNLHYGSRFYKELIKLLTAVEEKANSQKGSE